MRGFIGFITISAILFLAFLFIYIPLIFVDNGILLIMGEYTVDTATLFKFFLIFYLVDIIISLFAELIFSVIEKSQEKLWPRYVHITLETIVTFFVITIVDEATTSVNFSSWTHFFIALSHALLGELVSSKKSDRFTESR